MERLFPDCFRVVYVDASTVCLLKSFVSTKLKESFGFFIRNIIKDLKDKTKATQYLKIIEIVHLSYEIYKLKRYKSFDGCKILNIGEFIINL